VRHRLCAVRVVLCDLRISVCVLARTSDCTSCVMSAPIIQMLIIMTGACTFRAMFEQVSVCS
jgi:hypothetical protein